MCWRHFIGWFTFERNRWLLIVFLVYLATIFVFAVCYLFTYQHNPQNFAFNADILRRQSEVVKTITEPEVERLQVQLAALKRLSEKLDSSRELGDIAEITAAFNVPQQVEMHTTEYEFAFTKRMGGITPGGPPIYVPFVTIYDNKRNEIASLQVSDPSFTGGLPDKVEHYQTWVSILEESLRGLLNENVWRLSTLAGPSPEVWSFSDFLYFSAITQTTVGYGDMLPNSTLIRMLVTFQIVVGLFFIVVVINFVFRRYSN